MKKISAIHKNGMCQKAHTVFALSYSYFLSLSKYFLVSAAHTPLNAIKAIKFGMAIKPLKISAIVHTALTVMNGPINTAKMYNQR